MQINTELHGVLGWKTLREQCRHNTGESIAHAAARHAWIPGGVDESLSTRYRDDRARSLENHVATMLEREGPGDFHAISVDLCSRFSRETCHFARVRRKHGSSLRLLQAVDLQRQVVQGIRI